MKQTTLPEDVTLADVVKTLTKPEEYVRRAFLSLCNASVARDDLVLRIGRMGTGKAPHYRIDRRRAGVSPGGEAAPAYDLIADHHGSSHERLVAGNEPEDILREAHWSKASMSFAEMQALLRSVASPKRIPA